MNKTFKVVFNKARGALMVVNEATSSVQKKGTKTVIAAAVAAMGLVSAVQAFTPPEDLSDWTINNGNRSVFSGGVTANKLLIGWDESGNSLYFGGLRPGIHFSSNTISSATFGSETATDIIVVGGNSSFSMHGAALNAPVIFDAQNIKFESGFAPTTGGNHYSSDKGTVSVILIGNTTDTKLEHNFNFGTERTKNFDLIVDNKDFSKDISGIVMLNSGNKTTKYLSTFSGDTTKFHLVGGSTIEAIQVQNNTETKGLAESQRYEINLNAKNTSIYVNSGSKKGVGIAAFSGGIVKVKGNLNVEVDNGEGKVISTRGYSDTIINETGSNTVILKGDIVFETPNTPAADNGSGKKIDSNVDITLGEGSIWTGSAYQYFGVDDKNEAADSSKTYTLKKFVNLTGNPEYYGDVTGFSLKMLKGGTWNVTGDSFVNTLSLADGSVIKGTDKVTRLNVGSFKIAGANNQLLLSDKTVVTVGNDGKGKIIFEDAATSLTTNLATAYTLTKDKDSNAITDASAKLSVVGNGGTLSILDEFTYSATGLDKLISSYTTQGIETVSLAKGTPELKEGENLGLNQGIVVETENVVAKQDVSEGKATITTKNTGGATLTVADKNATKSELVKEVTLTDNMTLVGTATNDPLVQNEKGASVDKLTVDTTSTLNLGSANQEDETSGTLPELLVKGNVNVANITSTIEKIVTEGAAKINIGTAENRGALKIGEVKLAEDSMIFLDPDWSEDVSRNVIGNATHLEITDGNASELAGTVIVGRNSVLTYGGTVAQAEAGLNALGLKWGKDDVSAAAYIAETVDLATTGKFLVNGLAVNGEASTYTLPAAGTMALTDGSLLMINGSTIGDQAIKGALTATEKATVSVVNATDGKFKLADTVTGVTKIATDNQFVDSSIKDGVVTTDVNEQKLAGAVASMGVQQMARRADTVIANTIADRTAQTIAGEGVSLWADVGGERYEADDLDNGAQYEANMFYGAFGADVGITPNARIGAAIQYGTGDSKSDNYNIKNDIDAVSLALYGSCNVTDAAKIVGEFAWTKTSNDVTSSERLLKNDIDADVISLGVRGQHEFKVGALNIVPSLGLRVSRISTDAFNVGAVKVDVDDQTLVQIPLSVAFSADIEQAGWTMKPYAKVSFTPSFGDDEINVRGYDQSALDTMPVQGDFGLSATNGNVTFGAALSAGFGQDGAQNFGGKVGIRYAF